MFTKPTINKKKSLRRESNHKDIPSCVYALDEAKRRAGYLWKRIRTELENILTDIWWFVICYSHNSRDTCMTKPTNGVETQK